jgi:hypothetical protein
VDSLCVTLTGRRSPESPRALAVCDKCGFVYHHRDLTWDSQHESIGLYGRLVPGTTCRAAPRVFLLMLGSTAGL